MSAVVLNENKSIGIDNDRVFGFVNSAFGKNMHLKRVESLANAANNRAIGLVNVSSIPACGWMIFLDGLLLMMPRL